MNKIIDFEKYSIKGAPHFAKVNVDVGKGKDVTAFFTLLNSIKSVDVSFEITNNFYIMEDYLKANGLEDETFCQGRKVADAVESVLLHILSTNEMELIQDPEKFYAFVKERYKEAFNKTFSLPTRTRYKNWFFFFNSIQDRYRYAEVVVGDEIIDILKHEKEM